MIENNDKKRFLSCCVLALTVLILISCRRLGLPLYRFIGSAFCHQISDRTPEWAGRTYPFCYRCTGMFLGVFASFLFMKIKQTTPSIFSRYTLGFLLASGLFFIADILNSTTLADINIYPDQTVTRTLSGFFIGFALILLIAPFRKFLSNEKGEKPFPVLFNLIWAALTALFFVLLLYKGKGAAWVIITVLTCVTAAGLLISLYSLIVEMAALYFSKPIRHESAVLSGIVLGLLQITTLGILHELILRYL